MKTAFKSLIRNKTAGVDTLNSNLVPDTFDEINYTFKTSLQEGTFANMLNIAKVTPLFELGDAETLGAIGLFQFFHYSQKFLRESWKIEPINRSFDKGEHTLGIFVNLSKAFDTVDHKILIYKLEDYKKEGKILKWPKSYQSECKQCISCSDVDNWLSS